MTSAGQTILTNRNIDGVSPVCGQAIVSAHGGNPISPPRLAKSPGAVDSGVGYAIEIAISPAYPVARAVRSVSINSVISPFRMFFM